jgi:hypothetical protein
MYMSGTGHLGVLAHRKESGIRHWKYAKEFEIMGRKNGAKTSLT